MPFVTWSDNLSVGVKEIDDQHKKLITILNTLYEAMRVGKSKEVMEKIFKDLLDYTVYHFQTEEYYFKKYDYPEKLEHAKSHEALTTKAKELYEKYKAGSLMISIETMNFLKDWVSNHIMGEDKKYGPFLQSKIE